MRILFASYAEKTHFLTMVPLAWALQTARHEVRVASHPELTAVITGAGLTAVPVGRDHRLHMVLKEAEALGGAEDEAEPFDFAESRPEKLTWQYVSDGYRDVVPWWFRLINDTLADDLIDFCRYWRPELVIWEPATFAAPVAASVVGAVHARMMWSVDLFTRMRRHFLRLRAEQDAPEPDGLADWLDSLARTHGSQFDETMTTGHFTIDSVLDSLRFDPAFDLNLGLDYLPMRYVPYNGVAVIDPWLRAAASRPRVCLTMGVSSTERMSGYAVSAQELLDALADLDVEVVATLAVEEQCRLARRPANARIVSFAPLSALLPTCAVSVNHGGNGTWSTTVDAGVPQLVVPFFFDGGLRADYLAAQGAGLTMATTEVTGDRVRDAVVRLLGEDSFADNSARLSAEMRALPSPYEAVAAVEQRVTRYRDRVTA